MLEMGGGDRKGEFPSPRGEKHYLGICHDRRPIFHITRAPVTEEHVLSLSFLPPFLIPESHPLCSEQRSSEVGACWGENGATYSPSC